MATEKDEIEADGVLDDNPAISNQDVIEHILSFITSVKDLKNCRLVSKVWNEVSTIYLRKKTIFPIHKLTSTSLDAEYGVVIQPRLLRNVEIYVDLHDPTGFPLVRYLPFIAMHREDIENIRLTLDRGGGAVFSDGICMVLGGIQFPNLETLALETERPLPENYVRPPYKDDADIKEMFLNRDPNVFMNMNLITVTSLKLRLGVDGLEYTLRQNQATFQLLISNCPNLERLEMNGNFYPDFSSALKLKSLVWQGPVINYEEPESIMYLTTDFNLAGVVWMLEMVSDRLENLVLGNPIEQEAEDRYVSEMETGGMCFETEKIQDTGDALYPVMPKLKTLLISDVAIFAFNPESLAQNRFPALKKFTLRSTEMQEFPFRRFTKEWESCNNVVALDYLSINQVPVGESGIWREAVAALPNLKKLFVGMCPMKSKDQTGTPSDCMKNTLNLIASVFPKLEELSVQVKFDCTLEELMDAVLAKCFKGTALKKLKIVAKKRKGRRAKPESCDNFREPFMLYEALTLEGFLIERNTRERMINFISKRKRNVNLVDGEFN